MSSYRRNGFCDKAWPFYVSVEIERSSCIVKGKIAYRNVVLPHLEIDIGEVICVVPTPSRLAPDVLHDFIFFLELERYERVSQRIYPRKSKRTRCHRFLIATKVFEAPPDTTSLPARAFSHAAQALFFGVVTLQFPDAFCSLNVWTRMASSSRLHLVWRLSFTIERIPFVCRAEMRSKGVWVITRYLSQS